MADEVLGYVIIKKVCLEEYFKMFDKLLSYLIDGYTNGNKTLKEIKSKYIIEGIESSMRRFPFDDGLFNINNFEKSYLESREDKVGSYVTYEHPGIRNEYNTDIITKTCSCEDWRGTRSHYNTNDPRRLCKHLIQVIDEEETNRIFPYFKKRIDFYKKKGKRL